MNATLHLQEEGERTFRIRRGQDVMNNSTSCSLGSSTFRRLSQTKGALGSLPFLVFLSFRESNPSSLLRQRSPL
jgi:hypothetical protein